MPQNEAGRIVRKFGRLRDTGPFKPGLFPALDSPEASPLPARAARIVRDEPGGY